MKRASLVAIGAPAVLAGVLASGGCVERKMIVRSDPPGAVLALDGTQSELRTPAEIPFDFGGTRAVELTAPGHKVLEATATVKDPWFTYFPLDVVAEFVWPFTIHDVQTFDYKLEPYSKSVPSDQLAGLKQRLADFKLRAAEHRAGGSEGPGAVAPEQRPPSNEPPPPPPPKK